MTPHKAPIIGMLALVAVLMISSLGGPLAAAGWNTIQTDAQNADIPTPVIIWDGGGANNLASTAANWVGDIAPYAGVIVRFAGNSSKNCTWDLTITLDSFLVWATYTGTITLTASVTAGYLDISGGTITQGSPYAHKLVVNGYANIEAGTTEAGTINIKASGNSQLYFDIGYSNRLRNLEVTGTYTNYGYIYMGGTLLVNGTLTLNGHIFNYNSADIGVRGSGTVQSTSTYSYNMNSPSSGTTLTPAFEPTITGLNLVFSNNGNPAAYETFKIGNDISVKSIATPSGTTVSGLIVDMNGKAVTATNIYINKNATLTNTGAVNTLRFSGLSTAVGGVINGTNIRAYINSNGTLNAPAGTTFNITYMNNPGATITNQLSVSTNYIMLGLGATAYYQIWIDGLRWSAGTTDSLGRLYLTPGTLPNGVYLRVGAAADAWYSIQADSVEGFTFYAASWHTIQSDAQEGFTFAPYDWHIIQNDSKTIYFAPYQWYVIQNDDQELFIGTLITAQTFNGTLQSSGAAPVVEPGTDTETNLMGIIWLLVFFLPAIILFAYLGKLGGTIGLVLMSVVSAMAFDMGIFIMVVGIISAVIIMVESDGGD